MKSSLHSPSSLIPHFTSLILLLMFLAAACKKDAAHYERALDPFVFRSVLDSIPRIATAALHDDLFVAYNTETGALYKAWRGSVNFDGAVYTTAHGPQPSSLGNSWFVNKHLQPWRIVQNGQETTPKVQYRGHRFDKGQVWFNYELQLADGKKITVSERPEYATKGGQTGLERTFKTEGAPDGAQVILLANLSSIALESSIETDGEWKVDNKTNRSFKGLQGMDVDGRLTLKNKGETRFAAYFTNKPLVENTNKIEGAEDAENLPLGLRLINRADCKTCHNTFVATVGPSYTEVAQRYRNTADNIATLVAKVKNGGAGNWGEAAMTPHADLPDNDLTIMVKYIMNLDSLDESKLAAIPEGKKDLPLQEATGGFAEGDMRPGVRIKVYQYQKGLSKLADLKPFPAPVFEGVVPAVHAGPEDFGELTDNFGIVAEGYLNIPKDNNYVFRLISDDGSVLTIDDKVIVDHDGLHGDEPKDGEVALKAGYHPFKIEYFEAGGGNMISFRWKSFDDGGGNFEIVPPAALVHHKSMTPAGGSGMTLGSGSKIPGDKSPVAGVHPGYDLSEARPADFFPKVGGMDFRSDGKMVVSLWDAEGGVYVIDNAQSGDPSKMKATKIASGLHEPLGLKVVDDTIYVLQKQELTKLVDQNGDGVMDEYYTLCNQWGVSANFHEFAFGLVYKDGYFYGSLATDILPGGAGAPVQPKDRGRTFKIARNTGNIEFITSGLRTPNGIGIGVDGEIFNADNQGDWLPCSKIVHIKPGAFYGSRAVDFAGTEGLKMMNPVAWLPQDEIGNSPATPLALNDGPYKGQMIHGEVTHGGIKRVFVEKINGDYQGCVFRFIQGLEGGVNRMIWGPDGALYVGCIGNPGNWSDMQKNKKWYGLQRLKYNEKTAFEMLAVRAKSNGMEIEFTEPLEENIGWNPADYEVQQWWYKPTKDYGGPKMDLEKLKVLSASVSADRKKVFLELAGMKPEHVVYIRLPFEWISANGNELWSTEAWYTLNAIPAGALGEKRTAPIFADNTLTEAEKAAGWKLLFDGKSTAGWHSYGQKAAGKNWIVQDGAIHLDVTAKNAEGWQAKDGGDLTTDAGYANYELRLDWKIAPCGNSGVIYNIVEDPKYKYPWESGPEMQVLDNACHPDAMIEKHRAGDLYDLISTQYMTVKPAGQWNHVRLINRNGKVEHWLNGRKVVEVDMSGGDWAQLIAGSKFKEMPAFGKTVKGRIAIQDHGDRVWYKNLKIRELK
jgi:cytochrome c